MRQDVQALQDFIDLMVGVDKFSYPARQNNSKKPADEFAHIRLLEEYQVGIPNQKIKSQTDDQTIYRTLSPSRLRFRVGVVDTDGAAQVKIMHGWTSEAMKQLMITTGYGFINCHPLSVEDAKLEKEWELRTGFSIELYVTRASEETVDNITGMSIDMVYYASDVDTHSETYNINNI